MRKWLFTATLVAACGCELYVGQASGNWRMVASKSRLGAGKPPKSITARYEARAETEAWTFYQVQAGGILQTTSQTLHFDGKDYPCGDLGSNERPDTVVSRRLDAWTAEVAYKSSGRVTRRLVRKISPDGKQITLDIQITPEHGPVTEQWLVFEK
jgi:hypothetical protein